ncbi:MAG: inorganic phosphate transporter [Planctomycetota bacterium]|nr:inorganic phosphate transporter [Planctomycetota bacterium]
MDPLTILLVIALVGGLYMAWNIGANDVANAFGTSVGSGAISIRQAVLFAAVFEFAGAFFVGAPVAETISGSIVAPETFSFRPEVLGIGMVAALLASSVWLNIATFFGQPVSTTHAIIGAVVGFACVACGPACVGWAQMGTIAASWVVSPLAGGVLAYVIYRWGVKRYVLENRHPVYMAGLFMPVAMGALAGIVLFSVIYQGLPGLRLDLPLEYAAPIAAGVGLAVAVVIRLGIRRRMWKHHIPRSERYAAIERWFGHMQVATACYMSFAHGANDCANAIGPLAAAIQIFRNPSVVPDQIPIPAWLLAFGAAGIVLGVSTYGYKVIKTIGKNITEITPTRGFSAEFGTATSVLVFSKLGMPISTTFVIVGAVMGVGLARGFAALDLGVIRRIFTSWVITIPVSAGLSMVFYWILMATVG